MNTTHVGTWSPDGASEAAPSEDALIAACASVYDPEIPVNIYELGCRSRCVTLSSPSPALPPAMSKSCGIRRGTNPA